MRDRGNAYYIVLAEEQDLMMRKLKGAMMYVRRCKAE
jgi:hypothetical protein